VGGKSDRLDWTIPKTRLRFTVALSHDGSSIAHNLLAAGVGTEHLPRASKNFYGVFFKRACAHACGKQIMRSAGEVVGENSKFNRAQLFI